MMMMVSMVLSEDEEVVDEDDDVPFSLSVDCSFISNISAFEQVGVPEIDLQTIDNLGRTLIDVARYFYLIFDFIHICFKLLNVIQVLSNNFQKMKRNSLLCRDSHPLLVPVLQKKKSSKSSKTISKERLSEKKHMYHVFSLLFLSQIKRFFSSQIERFFPPD